ncbi:hypothetical protein BJ912DRAFT_1058799 [Pholiota molesta]|nr:hypothetical protein BJ912DRAFT_1058799 [Pholiota molesta]
MTTHPQNNGDGMSSEDILPPLNVSDLLLAITSIMLRTGRDFVLPRDVRQWDAALSGAASVATRPSDPAAAAAGAGAAATTSQVSTTTHAPAASIVPPAQVASVMAPVQAVGGAAPAAQVADSAAVLTPSVFDWASEPQVEPETLVAPAAVSSAPALPFFEGAILDVPPGVDINDPSVRWYSVTVGTSVGVFPNWASVAPFVVGIKAACYLRYSSKGEADAAFFDAVSKGAVRIVYRPGPIYPHFNRGPGGAGPNGGDGPSGAGGGSGVVA